MKVRDAIKLLLDENMDDELIFTLRISYDEEDDIVPLTISGKKNNEIRLIGIAE